MHRSYVYVFLQYLHLSKYTRSNQIIHWLVVSIPLKNISQLGWWNSLYGKIKAMFQSPPTRLVIIEHRLSIDYPWKMFQSPPTSFYLAGLLSYSTLRSHWVAALLCEPFAPGDRTLLNHPIDSIAWLPGDVKPSENIVIGKFDQTSFNTFPVFKISTHFTRISIHHWKSWPLSKEYTTHLQKRQPEIRQYISG